MVNSGRASALGTRVDLSPGLKFTAVLVEMAPGLALLPGPALKLDNARPVRVGMKPST